MPDRARGILLVLTATLFWGSEPLWVRSIGAGEWQILFWSGTLMAVGMFAWLAWVHRGRLISSIRATGFPGVVAAVSLTLAYSGYILSLNRTTVANTVVLLATAPLIAAVLGRIFLGEHLRRRTMLAMFLAFGGVVVMMWDSLGSIRLTGDLIALATGAWFAANIVALRAAPTRDGRAVDMMPSNAIAGIAIACCASFLDNPVDLQASDIPYLILIGIIAMGLGTWLFTRGVRHLEAAEAGLLCLGETVIAPLLVWIAFGETPDHRALTGAAIILAALVYDTMPERRPATLAD